ncbi:polysaccharide pyruvyl transferase family protein [Bacteroides ndongoniae]|uniref:polysaccharide pyruvyl transferase family protein n=1 Tax=Bacteroides ndongoniae TaxID=1903262 RepID=UPI0008D946A2|nr:polysaccharide pyruvyl transferase family protein [Bacteroides ndongoniae]
MKIGILTLPLHTNYGGILQAYALQTIIERMGHEPHLIKRLMVKRSTKKMLIYKSKSLIKKVICFLTLDANDKMRKSLGIRSFIKQYIIVDEFDSFEQIKKNQYDIIIVGSDQIWRPLYVKDIENTYLNFAVGWNIKRIAYGASFGVSDWEYTLEQTLVCKKLLREFDAVSVRELSGVKLCKEHFNVDAQWVLDPTMLLDKDDYINRFNLTRISKNTDYMFDYILDETCDKNAFIERIANKTCLQPFWRRNINEKTELPSVIEWLDAFYNSEFVVTDSFHGCVFSIIFQKKFIVFGNEKRGMARIQSLLNLLGLENRLVMNFEQLNEVCVHHIDWVIIAEKLQEFRNNSICFLRNNI